MLFVGDADSPDTPDPPAPTAPGTITAGPTCVAIPVRHEQDLEPDDADAATVTIRCRPGPKDEHEDRARFETVIDVPSGRLSVGDADHDHEVTVEPGRWRIQVDIEPPTDATRVEIWWSPDR